jgi:hypothetical protein
MRADRFPSTGEAPFHGRHLNCINGPSLMEAKSSLSLPDGKKVPMMLSVQYKVDENRQDITKEVTKNQ